MKEIIIQNINNPERLEELYHADKKSFEADFSEAYPELEKSELVKYWKIRLDFDNKPEKDKKPATAEIFYLIITCFVAGFLIKIPAIFNFSDTEEMIFYERNAGIIVFLGLAAYVVWINKITDTKRLLFIILSFLIPAIYINLLPPLDYSASISLAYIHMPILMWYIYGMVFIDYKLKEEPIRIEYLRYNGDLAIISAIMVIAGAILTAITIGLFAAIDIHIENFYSNNIVIVGAVCIPVIATYIIKNHPSISNKIAPLIANIFSPLVLLSALVFLVALFLSGKDLFKDRDFLIIFNLMLLGVMAVVIFSVSESALNRKQKFNEMILFILSIVSVLIDLFALSAIFYRLGTFGISPNRLAVLASNILILGNLILIIIKLYKVNFRKSELKEVGQTISWYLPVYGFWALLVVFGFPLIFGMK
jgi:hypothetical protein